MCSYSDECYSQGYNIIFCGYVLFNERNGIQCYQSIETNIGDHFYARTKLKLANRALWVARESSEEDPMTFIFDEILNLCEPEKFGESFASCRPATEGKKAGSINLYSISNYLLQMCFVDL